MYIVADQFYTKYSHAGAFGWCSVHEGAISTLQTCQSLNDAGYVDYLVCDGLQKFRLGVPIRDMRLLDPNLLTSETGKILVRPIRITE